MSENSEGHLDAVYRVYLLGYVSSRVELSKNYSDIQTMELSELTAFAIGMKDWDDGSSARMSVDLIEEVNELLSKASTGGVDAS